MSLCDNCMNFPCTDGMSVMLKSCPAYNPKPKPQTNADRIRSMTDEELAEWFSIYCCRNKTYDAHCDTFGNCKDCWLDWLKEEVVD